MEVIVLGGFRGSRIPRIVSCVNRACHAHAIPLMTKNHTNGDCAGGQGHGEKKVQPGSSLAWSTCRVSHWDC